MEKATVMGCACVVISRLTAEQLDRFQRYDPDALSLKKDGETVFTIRKEDGPGALLEDGAVYGHSTTKDGRATITVLLNPDAEDRAQLVKDRLGPALLKLDELEQQLLARADEVRQMEEAAAAMISVV